MLMRGHEIESQTHTSEQGSIFSQVFDDPVWVIGGSLQNVVRIRIPRKFIPVILEEYRTGISLYIA